MLGAVKKIILNNKQGRIKKRFPNLNITLHPDMPSPSMDKMVEVAHLVEAVNSFEARISSLNDKELAYKTEEFKSHLKAKSEEINEELEQFKQAMLSVAIPEEKEKLKEKLKFSRNKIFAGILPEAFAVVREASRRTIGLRHFDVQIAGGIILHEGRIAEMSTGEGKTLVATLAAYLNALLGKGVHIVTVNDYLARRDREWMGPIYEFLGLSVGTIQHDMSDEERKIAYACDITYGTNNEFGFDYLRDNMKYSIDELVQRPFYYAIVDEVDSILIDEARTPLIISGPAEESTEKYYLAKKIVEQLSGRRITQHDEIDAKYKGIDLGQGFDYIADEKAQTVALTESGELKASKLWNVETLHSLETIEYRHHTISALRAKEFFQRDVDYVIKDGQVIIVDEFTGRLMPGRRWSDGLHQAVEAKEGLKIERENQTLATITFQNYFRMYEKLGGMTGTAFTESNEFKSIYQLDVVVLPTNQPLVRQNYPDRIYKTEDEKFAAVVEEIAELSTLGKPVLVGTITIDKSERLSDMLKRRGIAHQVLNAKHHEMEASIIAQAGRFKAVTIATNMAGRGTDILLGGNPEFIAKSVAKQKLNPEDSDYNSQYQEILERYKREASLEHNKVVELGGLHVLGTERHEARRIDNQLRGRSGRQGDPGSSRFYVSLKDDLMRLFGSDRIIGLMDKLGLEEGQVIEHPWVSGSIEIAQRRVEQHNFEIRKQLLEYDNVMNKQREIIYSQRRQILEGFSLKDNITEIIYKLIEDYLKIYSSQNTSEIDTAGLVNFVVLNFGLELNGKAFANLSNQDVKEKLTEELLAAYQGKEESIGQELLRNLERMVFLQIIDAKWKDHLYAMDSMREGIGLRAYGQRDPLIEYKREAFGMFSQMITAIEEDSVQTIFKLQPAKPDRFQGVFGSLPKEFSHPATDQFQVSLRQDEAEESDAVPQQKPDSKPVQPNQPKVGRNDPCPCGSGKKYKKCCGK
ncbi:MAG: preprotein translocase subunit SecA [Candidatus Omnitrophica bacterium]|nr:preprotein translocase subunit SecA [Candidatus Omnitrophota bacterium]MDD5660560.1 preprotein translocase subunit SecA [Candidatus Omnitrophota bacterium]